MLMRGRLEEMSEYVPKNMRLAQTWQKSWYEKDTRERSFQHGTPVSTQEEADCFSHEHVA